MDQCNHKIRCDYFFLRQNDYSIDNYIFSKIIILRRTPAAMIVNIN